MTDDDGPATRPLLFLNVRVAAERQDDLLEFLREAIVCYEELPGVQVRLLQSREDPQCWIELIEYPDHATFETDQRRVEQDPRLIELLDRWHTLLDGPVDVETWEDWTGQLKDGRNE